MLDHMPCPHTIPEELVSAFVSISKRNGRGSNGCLHLAYAASQYSQLLLDAERDVLFLLILVWELKRVEPDTLVRLRLVRQSPGGL